MKDKFKLNGKIFDDPRVIAFLISIVCIVLIAFCVYVAKDTKAAELRIEDSIKEFNDNKSSIENLLALKERASDYEKKNEVYENLITSDGFNKQQFMVDFDSMCNDLSCRMTVINFGEQYDYSGVKHLPITITVEGDFNSIMTLTGNIISQERYYRIDGITINAENEDKVATINIVAFSK